MLAIVRRPTLSLISNRKERRSTVDFSLEQHVSYGIGSGAGGRSITYVACSNDRATGEERGRCTMVAQLSCSQLNNTIWQPSWIVDGRRPSFRPDNVHISLTGGSLWNEVPGFDVLNLKLNEGQSSSLYQDFKICLTSAGDLRNLIRTVNSLPQSYQGQCDILFNDPDAISANRNLLILYILLTPGPPVDEVAELALHLMYSARLTSLASAYVRRCVSSIYGDLTKPAEMTFQRTFASRGKGKLHSTQPATSIKRPVEMFLSRYDLSKALRRRRDTLLDLSTVDDRHKILASFEPAHRLAVVHFWKTGVLAPHSLDLTEFTEPNRALFTPQGSWLGSPDDIFPFQGWDMHEAQESGQTNRLEPSDIFGYLFFHVREELRRFVNRIKSLNISIHHTQYDPRVLSKGLPVGVLPSLTEALFDRVDLGSMPDHTNLSVCLHDWAPLLKHENPHSCLVLSFSRWTQTGSGSPSRDLLSNPETILEMLKRRCKNIPSLRPRLKKLLEQGLHSPSIIRLIESLDVFVDTGPAFQDYLHSQSVIEISEELGIRQKRRNTVQPKRFGLSLDGPQVNVLPDISKEEYYGLFVLGRASLLTRFVEFEKV
ncbi:hypothetical protein BKA70DRAFT_1179846 [Coprinopsis sp. MPI-PUGE-AT-0042]|nr:hypothetical protein BKA70DRAFT_1179846 [Coprinopsis sp. MPI-PUGE-AT-0042]